MKKTSPKVIQMKMANFKTMHCTLFSRTIFSEFDGSVCVPEFTLLNANVIWSFHQVLHVSTQNGEHSSAVSSSSTSITRKIIQSFIYIVCIIHKYYTYIAHVYRILDVYAIQYIYKHPTFYCFYVWANIKYCRIGSSKYTKWIPKGYCKYLNQM